MQSLTPWAPSQVGLGDTGSGQPPQWASRGSSPAGGTQRAVQEQAAYTGGKQDPQLNVGPSPQPALGPRCAAGPGASTVSGLKTVPGHARLQSLGKERAGGESACPGSVRNGAVWVCQRDSGLSPGSQPVSPTRPAPLCSSPCLGRPSPAPSLSSQAAEGAGGDEGPPPRPPGCQALPVAGSARGRARVTPHAGLLPGGHLGPGPAEHRGPVPWGECPQRVALGETRTPVLLLPRQTGPGVRGVWAGRGAAGLPPPMGNSLPGTWNERPSQATRPSSRQCAPSVQESRAGHPAASAARCHGLGEGRVPGVRAHC